MGAHQRSMGRERLRAGEYCIAVAAIFAWSAVQLRQLSQLDASTCLVARQLWIWRRVAGRCCGDWGALVLYS